MLRKYRMGFDVWVLVLFAAVMLPNVIWFALPAPNDILRVESVTPVVDTVGSVFQVLMIAALCMFIRTDIEKKGFRLPIIGAILCVTLYWLCWVLYYCGTANTAVILGLTLPPCFAFILYALHKKNGIAAIFAGGFTICHLIFALANFVL